MILALLVLIVAVAVAKVRGGSLGQLAETRFRLGPLLFVSLALQVGVEFTPLDFQERLGVPVMVVSQGAVAAFLIANRRLAGMALAGAGLALNVIVIATNGAMPVAPAAARAAGIGDWLREPGIKHEVLTAETHFPWLADVIPLPPVRQVVSIGDVVLAVGIGRFVLGAMSPPADEEATAPTLP